MTSSQKIKPDKRKLFRQGDLLIEEVGATRRTLPGKIVDPDCSVVLLVGEETGHSHRLTGPDVTVFHDVTRALEIPRELYLGHMRLGAPAVVSHEEHGPIDLPAGTYRLRRQRQREPGDEMAVIAD